VRAAGQPRGIYPFEQPELPVSHASTGFSPGVAGVVGLVWNRSRRIEAAAETAAGQGSGGAEGVSEGL